MKRIIATSDWHGLCDRAHALIAKTNYDPETDSLVVLGDLIDRGPDSLGCVAYARELEKQGAVILMGNHEFMATEAFREIFADKHHPRYDQQALAFHLDNGGDAFWKQVNDQKPQLLDMMRWFEHLRMYHQVTGRGDNYVFVHAGWDTTSRTQDVNELLCDRTSMFKRPHPKDYTIVFGHTPTNHLNHDGRYVIYKGDHMIGVDCGGVYPGGLLAAVSLPDGEEFYA